MIFCKGSQQDLTGFSFLYKKYMCMYNVYENNRIVWKWIPLVFFTVFRPLGQQLDKSLTRKDVVLVLIFKTYSATVGLSHLAVYWWHIWLYTWTFGCILVTFGYILGHLAVYWWHLAIYLDIWLYTGDGLNHFWFLSSIRPVGMHQFKTA